MGNTFPENFIFGAATSSFQIEGRPYADGAQPSIWSSFCKKKFTVSSGHNGNIACDHYSMWEEDIRIMKSLKLDSYRFSISWPRILPRGTGKPNEQGLDFYDKLVDKLLESGISPMITLYHWDLPDYLEKKGGWSNPEIPDWFANYTEATSRRLADRVTKWTTFNEPWVFMHLGMITGEHAPGYRSVAHAASAWKHIILAHSRSVKTLRASDHPLEVGLACNVSPFLPASQSISDVEACNRMHDYHNKLFLDPWLKNEIPTISELAFGTHLPSWTISEIKELSTPVDFVGINYYSPTRAGYHPDAFLSVETKPPRKPVTDMNWEIYPEGLYHMIKWVYDSYNADLYVTENGCAFSDAPGNGNLRDNRRITYLDQHLNQCLRAINDGFPLKGYYAWSLLDNFEWSYGYDKRFGLVYVDFNTQKRVIKDSGNFYRDVITKHKKPDTHSAAKNVKQKSKQVYSTDSD